MSWGYPSWFKTLFGFAEGSYTQTKSRFVVEGTKLRSKENERSYAIGNWSTPTVGELREMARSSGKPGQLKISHMPVGDVLEMHGLPENEGALFQAASQFNCLEFAGPSVVPEDGVTRYDSDATQGPACSLACGAATVYRNYFAPVNGHEGQTRENQLNTLDELEKYVDNATNNFWKVKNGYTNSSSQRLQRFAAAMDKYDYDTLVSKIKIGLQQQVQVTFSERYEVLEREHLVSQAFCSAISCAYTCVPDDDWEPLACLVLDAMYEATLLAATVNAGKGLGSNVVYLTFVGGGVFGNLHSWIASAIGRACALLADHDLDVRILHLHNVNDERARRINREFAEWCKKLGAQSTDSRPEQIPPPSEHTEQAATDMELVESQQPQEQQQQQDQKHEQEQMQEQDMGQEKEQTDTTTDPAADATPTSAPET